MLKKMASAVGGKTARACDGCVRKRARWYCAADDAFLCQSCDSSVHSANSLAKRHERVRLKTASSFKRAPSVSETMPSWQRDVIRKPRTPRGGKHITSTSKSEYGSTRNPFSLVPEFGVDETTSICESEDQLVYSRVPVYDPFVAELCTSANSNEEQEAKLDYDPNNNNSGVVNPSPPRSYDISKFNEFLTSEMNMEEFAADVESLLGKGLENESYNMEGLGLVEIVKDENETTARVAFEMMSFEYDDCSGNCGEVEVDDGDGTKETLTMVKTPTMSEKMLRLDYDGVIESWAGLRCPWAGGARPNIDPAHCWPPCMGSCGLDGHSVDGGTRVVGIGQGGILGDAEREARVSRYKEKRRTRLFSKKIRYEVRKLNAEKRPRMKGRFVKRSTTSFGGDDQSVSATGLVR